MIQDRSIKKEALNYHPLVNLPVRGKDLWTYEHSVVLFFGAGDHSNPAPEIGVIIASDMISTYIPLNHQTLLRILWTSKSRLHLRAVKNAFHWGPGIDTAVDRRQWLWWNGEDPRALPRGTYFPEALRRGVLCATLFADGPGSQWSELKQRRNRTQSLNGKKVPPNMVVSWNRGTPKSSILLGFSIIKQLLLDTPMTMETSTS